MTLLAALVLAVAPVTLPSGNGWSVEDKIAVLAQSEARSLARFEWGIYDDPALRAEFRRVGLRAGCGAVREATQALLPVYEPKLRPTAARAIRDLIPAERFDEARAISFLAFPFNIYSGRVRARVDELAASEIATARADMRRRFLARTTRLPNTASREDAAPADLSSMLNLNGRWNFDSPAQIGLACADLKIDRSIRPTITTGSVPAPSGVIKQ